jgi:hypothetical protein
MNRVIIPGGPTRLSSAAAMSAISRLQAIAVDVVAQRAAQGDGTADPNLVDFAVDVVKKHAGLHSMERALDQSVLKSIRERPITIQFTDGEMTNVIAHIAGHLIDQYNETVGHAL